MANESSHPSVSRRFGTGAVRRNIIPLVMAVAGVMATAALAEAQSSGKGFLFNKPSGSFSLRGGWAYALAGSDIFEETTTQLTLDKKDFSSLTFGGDISWFASDKFDLVFDAEFARSSKGSEMRDWVDVDDKPIEQTTKYRRVPLTVGVRYYLQGRGRAISNFAYIPSKYAPYVGAGAGAIRWSFAQDGDFVDFQSQNLAIRRYELEDAGWAPMAHGMAGFDYNLGPWLALNTEARYQWARAELDPQVFEGFEKIDLSGFSGTVGFKVRF
jgi:hypothetical protein